MHDNNNYYYCVTVYYINWECTLVCMPCYMISMVLDLRVVPCILGHAFTAITCYKRVLQACINTSHVKHISRPTSLLECPLPQQHQIGPLPATGWSCRPHSHPLCGCRDSCGSPCRSDTVIHKRSLH